MKALLLFSAIAAASAAPLNAQGTVDQIGAKVRYRMDSAMAKRGALGLELRTTGTRRDTLGVFVDAVIPKGPAETAGIIEGDRIASINGVDLRTAVGDTDDSYANGLAAHRLSREVQKLTPGSRANLRVYSGGRFRDVQVTAGKASEVMGHGGQFRFMSPGMDGMMELDGPDEMMLEPDMQMMRDRMEPLMKRRMESPTKERIEPLTKERMEPLLRQPLNELPSKIRIRAPVRVKTLAPVRAHRILSVDAAHIVPVSAEEIRELVATTIRDAQSALKQLAADEMS
jgi:hypothetical protein